MSSRNHRLAARSAASLAGRKEEPDTRTGVFGNALPPDTVQKAADSLNAGYFKRLDKRKAREANGVGLKGRGLFFKEQKPCCKEEFQGRCKVSTTLSFVF